MSIFLIGLAIVFLFGIKTQKNKNDYLGKDITTSFSGLFVLIIFCSHFFGYIDTSVLNAFDKPLFLFTNYLGQLMVSPFLFFSGYGVFESFKKRGPEYADTMPKNRLLKVYLSFFVAWVLFACVALFFKSNYALSDYLLSLVGVKTLGNSNWYVVVILALYLISFLSFKVCGKNKSVTVIIHAGGVCFLYVLLYFIAPGEWWYNTLVCYLFGVLFSFFKDNIDSFLAKGKANGWLFLIASSLSFAGLYIANAKISIPWLNHLLYVGVNLFFCLTIVAFLYLFQIKNKVLLFLGNYCFWIYILQRIPMIVFSHSSFVSGNRYVYFILSLVATMVLAFVIGKAFSYVWKIVFLRKGDVGEVTNTRIGIVISYVSLAFSILGAFIVMPRLLEWLGDTQYGLRSFATSIATWLTVISSALAASYLRFINISNKENGIGEGKTNCLYTKIFLFLSLVILLLTIIATGLCFAFNASFGDYSKEENNLIILLIFLSGINVAIQMASSVFTHYLTYQKEFIFIRSLSLVTTFLMFALELIFVFLTKSVVAVAVVTLTLTIISLAMNAFFAIKLKKMPFENIKLKEGFSVLKAIVVFSSFILLNAVVDQINHEVDITILGFMTNAEKVTDYTLARYFTTHMISLSVAVSGTYAPRVHELVKKDDKPATNDLFQRVSKTQLVILTFVVGGFAACGHSFMYIWLGDSKEYIYFYSLVLLSLNVIPLSCNLGIEVQRAMNKHKFRALLYIVFALLNVVISILLIAVLPNEMAIWGAIFGTIFSIGIGNIVVLNVYNHVVIKLDMVRYFLNVLKYVIIACIAVLPCVFFSLIFSNELSHVLMFLINGLTFAFVFAIELLIVDRKTVVPLAKKIIKKLK